MNLSTDKMSMAMTSSNDQITGERIDRLMTVEIRPLNGGLPAGYVVPMYNVCRCTTCAALTTVCRSVRSRHENSPTPCLAVTSSSLPQEPVHRPSSTVTSSLERLDDHITTQITEYAYALGAKVFLDEAYGARLQPVLHRGRLSLQMGADISLTIAIRPGCLVHAQASSLGV